MKEGDNKYILKYNCYATKNYCNSISEKIIGCCDNCLEKYNINIDDLTENNLYKNYLLNEHQFIFIIKKLLKKTSNTIGKENKTKIVFKIFNHNLNNIYYVITHFKYLIIVLDKIYKFINEDILILKKSSRNNDEYYDIFIKIKYIYEFLKNNKKYYIIRKNKNIKNKYNNLFLSEFITFMKKIYEKNIDYKLLNINI